MLGESIFIAWNFITNTTQTDIVGSKFIKYSDTYLGVYRSLFFVSYNSKFKNKLELLYSIF